ncbi:MAG: hypothetical protein QOD63_768, partial [Actinomycetota bacterium]|nr:hypothetical protein [Actinomycetota bacterium]
MSGPTSPTSPRVRRALPRAVGATLPRAGVENPQEALRQLQLIITRRLDGLL